MNNDYVEAIYSLDPLAEFHTDENGIVWHKNNKRPQPTDTQVRAEILRLKYNKTVLSKIDNLEAEQTPRLMREALAGISFAVLKMAQIDADIAALRLQLK